MTIIQDLTRFVDTNPFVSGCFILLGARVLCALILNNNLDPTTFVMGCIVGAVANQVFKASNYNKIAII